MANIVDERGYNQIYGSSPAQAIRLRRRAEAMVREMNLPEGPERRKGIHILEIGCGMGELTYHLAQITGACVTGVDLSPQFIEHAAASHQHPNLAFAVVDLRKATPAAEQQKYHYIVGNGILHHLYFNLDEVLPRLARWLRPGGRLVFWEPNLHNPYIYAIFSFSALRRWARLEPDEMAFSAQFIRRQLTQAGYSNISATPRDYVLPNTPRVLVGAVVLLGSVLEHVPLVRATAQSLFIVAALPNRI